jgi:hypothetical protein
MNLPKSNDEWLSIIQKCRASGLSDKDWCREHGVATSSFYYNVRKLRKLACDIPQASIQTAVVPQEVVPLMIKDDNEFVIPDKQQESLEHIFQEQIPSLVPNIIIESRGIRVTCPDGISSSMVSSVIHALRELC